jgi:hypothetical protein
VDESKQADIENLGDLLVRSRAFDLPGITNTVGMVQAKNVEGLPPADSREFDANSRKALFSVDRIAPGRS